MPRSFAAWINNFHGVGQWNSRGVKLAMRTRKGLEMKTFFLPKFHKIDICPTGTNTWKVIMDGKNLHCTGYTIYQRVDEVPTIELELLGYGRFSGDAKVGFGAEGVKEICKYMSLENLKEVIQLWNSCHDANLALVDLTALEDAITKRSEKNA